MQKPSPEPQIGSRTISRVLYHSALADGMATVIPLGAQLPVPSSNLPGSVDRADPLPYLVLLRTGLAELVTSPCRLVGSYPTVSPLPPRAARAVCFLLRLPEIALPGYYPASRPAKPGLSSPDPAVRGDDPSGSRNVARRPAVRTRGRGARNVIPYPRPPRPPCPRKKSGSGRPWPVRRLRPRGPESGDPSR